MSRGGWHRALIAVGANIEPRRNLPRALALLAERVRVRGVSGVYRTVPRGSPGAPPFLNAAVAIDTRLPPAELRRRVLRPIEARLGRVRLADRNAPRTIDLDLVLYDDLVAERGGLRLPDPEILCRSYLATPLADLEPDRRHPETGRRLAEIAAELGPPGPRQRLPGWVAPSAGPA